VRRRRGREPELASKWSSVFRDTDNSADV
jgi:hypothetical protein